MIELREVSKTVTSGSEPLTILHPLTTEIPRGQFLAIVGPSGSGKTTLLSILGCILTPTSGNLRIAGVPTDRIAVEPALETGLDRALDAGDGPLFALPTYTAMLALRDLLVARGAVHGSFS